MDIEDRLFPVYQKERSHAAREFWEGFLDKILAFLGAKNSERLVEALHAVNSPLIEVIFDEFGVKTQPCDFLDLLPRQTSKENPSQSTSQSMRTKSGRAFRIKSQVKLTTPEPSLLTEKAKTAYKVAKFPPKAALAPLPGSARCFEKEENLELARKRRKTTLEPINHPRGDKDEHAV